MFDLILRDEKQHLSLLEMQVSLQDQFVRCLLKFFLKFFLVHKVLFFLIVVKNNIKIKMREGTGHSKRNWLRPIRLLLVLITPSFKVWGGPN